MHKLGFAVSSALMCALATTATAGDLRLSIANGRVTIVAQDVPVRQILDEWGRVGQTQVVGAERLTGTPVTLELHDVPEGRALETLLRSASGYIAKPRSGTAGTSSYDRILIMPASKPPAMSAAPPAFNASRPQPQVVMPNVVVDDDDEPNGIMPPGAVPPQQFPGQPPLQPGMQHRNAAWRAAAADADADASRAAAAAVAEYARQSVPDRPAAGPATWRARWAWRWRVVGGRAACWSDQAGRQPLKESPSKLSGFSYALESLPS